MRRIISQLIIYFAENPKKLFLIDGIGALMTAFFLFVIMGQFNEYFGMPRTVLTYLSIIAISFCIYSTACFLFLKRRWATFIKLIGIVNLLYCVLTVGLLIKYFHLLTIIGTAYFWIEIVIICVLSYIELNVATRNQEKKLAASK